LAETLSHRDAEVGCMVSSTSFTSSAESVSRSTLVLAILAHPDISDQDAEPLLADFQQARVGYYLP
jgi:hypothetical protein